MLKTTLLGGGGLSFYLIHRHFSKHKTCLTTKRGETGFMFLFHFGYSLLLFFLLSIFLFLGGQSPLSSPDV